MNSTDVADRLREAQPELRETIPTLLRLSDALAEVFEAGGTLFVAGNGGSAADAQHIAGELMKSFERRRPLASALRASLAELPRGRALADTLEGGLRTIALGLNHSLTSAVGNDFSTPHLEYAQELAVLAKAGDALLAISTSGRAVNVGNAALVAKAKGLLVAALTGPGPHQLGEIADLVLQAPAQRTAEIQEQHRLLAHALCRMLEDRFFGDE